MLLLRIRIGWNKFRQLVLLLSNKDISLINDKNCSLSIALTAMDQKLQKS